MRTTLAFAFAFLVAPLAAQNASLVRDIETGVGGAHGFYGTDFQDLTPVAGKLFFVDRSAIGSRSGVDLWVTDGTPQGTKPVVTPCRDPAECDPDSRIVGSVGAAVLFATGRSSQIDLWRSDGTRAGTYLLRPGLDLAESSPTTSFRSAFFFSGCVGDECGLWKTDGSTAGTVEVGIFPAGSRLVTLDVVAGRLMFTVADKHGAWLWVSDGTTAGTSQIQALAAFSRVAAVVGTRLFLGTWKPGVGTQLWVTDGTAAGTRVVRDFAYAGFSFPGDLVAAGGRVYFLANDGGSSGIELWTSDGTAAGTYNASALGPDNPFFTELTAVGDRVVYLAWDGLQHVRLWASRGGRAAAVPLTDLCEGCSSSVSNRIVAVGSRAVFVKDDGVHGIEPWVTDGTAAGTHLLADLCPGRCSSTDPYHTPFLALPGGVLFVADDRVHGDEIWITDGTAAGTVRRSDLGDTALVLGTEESPPRLVASFLGPRLYFGVTDEMGPSLWTSDGPAQSHRVTVIYPQGPTSWPEDLFGWGDRLLFSASGGDGDALWSSQGTPDTTQALGLATRDGLSAPLEPTPMGNAVFVRRETSRDGGSLWRTDGTAAGTVPAIVGVNRGIAAWQGELYFGFRTQIWKTDGTAGGLMKVLDVPADPSTEVSYLAALGPELYFFTVDGGGDLQVWRTDGSPAGTRKLVDTEWHGFEPAAPQFTRIGANVFFLTGYDELWRTDGTAAGTVRLGPWRVHRLAVFQGALYFMAQDADFSLVLWRSDGTPAGTAPVTTAVTAPLSGAGDLAEYQGRLWFAGDDGVHGLELWSTDGTAAGTVLASDIRPGADSSDPYGFTVAGGRLFFAANDGIHGMELWQSDGTAAGTRQVQDVAPFGASSSPAQLTVAGDRLYFVASDGPSGREVWSLPLAQPACLASSTALCLSGGRFRVEVRWRDFQGNTGVGRAVPLTGDTGYFWFFDPANVEVVLKVLDGRGTNDHFWVFYGALSSVEYVLTVTDTQTGLTRQYINPSGQLSSLGDTNGFGPLGAAKSRQASLVAPPSALPLVATRTAAAATGPCQAGPQRLCLGGGRFAVEVAWKDFGGRSGPGTAVALAGSGDTGWFWFFDPANLELMVKVLDGTGVNGKHWVFYGALSSVEYTLTVTDTQTGEVRTYRNPAGRLASAADTGAF